MSRLALWAGFGLAAAATPAFAHTGHDHAFGLAHGFAHPFGGIDHLLAMVAVGCLAGQMGGRALWAVPAAFLAMMTAGGALGLYGIGLPFVETAIALSVVAFGASIALTARMPVALAMTLVGAFALFHGHAHGAEMPDGGSGLSYALGFVAATAVLHGIGLALARVSPARLVTAAGAGVAVAGVTLIAGPL